MLDACHGTYATQILAAEQYLTHVARRFGVPEKSLHEALEEVQLKGYRRNIAEHRALLAAAVGMVENMSDDQKAPPTAFSWLVAAHPEHSPLLGLWRITQNLPPPPSAKSWTGEQQAAYEALRTAKASRSTNFNSLLGNYVSAFFM
jgi:hypothetical protein